MVDISPLLRRRGLVLTVALVVAVAAAAGLTRLELDNAPEAFFAGEHRDLAAHRQLVAAFGSDRAVRVVVSGRGLWTPRGLGWLRTLEEQLEELPGVLGAAGLSRHRAATTDRWPPTDAVAFREQATADRVARGAGWISADGSLATVVVVLARPPARGAAGALAAVEDLAAGAPPGLTTRVVGLPVVEQALDDEVTAMASRFLPVLALALAVALAALFRRRRQVAAVIGFVALVEAVTLGAMGWSGARLDVVTGLLMPLLAVVATTTAVHLLVRFRHLRERGLAAPAAARELVRQKAQPVVWAGITTIASFASLTVAPVPAVRSLGIWAAFGFATTTLAALSLLPCLLAGEVGSDTSSGRWPAEARRLGLRWAATAVARRRAVYATFTIAALLAVVGALRLRPANDLLGLLSEDHPVRLELTALEASGLGTASADLLLILPPGLAARFDDADSLARLERLSQRLRARPLVWGVTSAGDLVAGWRGNEDEDGPAGLLRAHRRVADRPAARRLFASLVTVDGRRARLPLSLPMAETAVADPFFVAAREDAVALFPGAQAFVTGTYPLLLAAQRSLLVTMLASLALAIVVVAATLRIVLAASSLAGRALVANLWPVLIALGVMGWARVPLDSSTVAVAAVALGLAVDDSVHTFADFRQLAPKQGVQRAVVAAVGRNAPAHLATAFLLASGLALWGLSGFVPAARFGLSTAVAVGAALVADLWLVPALLSAAPIGRGVRPPDGAAGGSRRRRRGGPAPAG